MPDAATTNYLLALGTVALQVVFIALFAAYLLHDRVRLFADVMRFVRPYVLHLAFFLSLSGLVLTLYYSEILGFEPCPLCWWQRIFLYPQVILFALALWKRDTHMALYAAILSLFGLGFSIYHHALQMLPAGSLPCPATGVSCAQRIVFEFGYITFPMMAVTLFGVLLVLMLFERDRDLS